MSKKPYYITTAIAYTSGKPHIGNTYEIVLADSIARFRRMQGYIIGFLRHVFLLTLRANVRKFPSKCPH